MTEKPEPIDRIMTRAAEIASDLEGLASDLNWLVRDIERVRDQYITARECYEEKIELLTRDKGKEAGQ